VNQGTGEVILGVWVLLAWFFFIYLKNIYPADFALERVGFWIWLGRKVDSII
jgi:hypothetical protein